MKRNIDLNLLVCLDALLAERSVTRAAQRLEMSQPGMSNALARLRRLTGDPLLIRSGNGLQPTGRALALAGKVRSGLATLEEIFADEGPFDPAHAQGTVTLAAADSVGMVLLPRLVEAIGQCAPRVLVNIRLPDPEKLREWLIEGECDIAIGHFPGVAEDLRSTELFSQTLACILGPGHPLADTALTLADYLDCTHVTFGSPFSPRSTLETTIDQALARLGGTRRRAVQVSSVMLIPYIVAQSGQVATLPGWLARHHARFLPLRVKPVPFESPPIECRMVWHDRTHRLGLQRWARHLLRTATHQMRAGDVAGHPAAWAPDIGGIRFADAIIDGA